MKKIKDLLLTFLNRNEVTPIARQNYEKAYFRGNIQLAELQQSSEQIL